MALTLAADAPPAEGPILLELFTSQGCSSCPPADRVLSRLAASPEWRGKIAPLAFHVDYWNYIGWTDPFSSPAWSGRQEAYAAAWGSSRIYTPQLVVGGEIDCSGADEGCIGRALRKLADRVPSWRLGLTLRKTPEGGVEAEVTARSLAPGPPPGELFVAIAESGLITAVGRGENARRTLANDCVVRRLLRLGGVKEGVSRAALELDPAWKRAGLSVVAFLQNPESRRIEAAAFAAAID